jgi:hypothetical protein
LSHAPQIRSGFGNAACRIARARQFARPVPVAARGCVRAADRSACAFGAWKIRASVIQSPFGVVPVAAIGNGGAFESSAGPYRPRSGDIICSGIITCSGMAAAATFISPIVLSIIFAAERSLDSVRIEAREVEHRRTGCPRNNPRAKWNYSN